MAFNYDKYLLFLTSDSVTAGISLVQSEKLELSLLPVNLKINAKCFETPGVASGIISILLSTI